MTDVVIVGAGSAGCVLAARLSEDSTRSVMLIEAGPDYPAASDLPRDVRSALAPTMTHDWGYTSEGTAAVGAIPLPRAKLVGGCSATNGAFALRGPPADYDEWAALGNDGWSFADVLPAFRALESDADFAGAFHGQGGPVPVRRFAAEALVEEQRAFLVACVSRGYPAVDDHNAPDAIGAGSLPMNAVDGVRLSTALTHLAGARSRTNLKIRSSAPVDRITFDGSRATGVRLASGEMIPAGHVILAAGAYNSPAILMRSGIGDAEHLRAVDIEVRAHLPAVGAHLADHPRLRVRFASKAHASEVQGCQAVLTFTSTAFSTTRDLQVFPWSTTAEGVFVLNCALMKPYSTGTVHLRSSDPMDAPLIDCGFFADERDMPRMIDAVRAARELGATPPLAAIAEGEVYPGPLVSDDSADLEPVIRAELRTYFHPVGTCRMGTGPDAVVDVRGRVHGVEGISVIDASIMPRIPAANTNLPTIMIAERCAAMFG